MKKKKNLAATSIKNQKVLEQNFKKIFLSIEKEYKITRTENSQWKKKKMWLTKIFIGFQ